MGYAAGMRGMVFAAGFGTRLRPLTDYLPKPVVPVGNRPLAWFALDHLARSGVDEVVLNTHHLGERIRAELEGHIPSGMQVGFVHEPCILGTGGGLKNAWKPRAGETFVVMNGDVIFAPDLQAALKMHRRHDAIATMILRPTSDPDRYGSIEVDGTGRVRRILDQSAPDRGHGPRRKLMFAGVHLLSARAHAWLPDDGCIIRKSYLRWLKAGEHIAAIVDDAPWHEVGSPAAYLETNLALAEGTLRWLGIQPDENGVLAHPQARIAPDAKLRNVVLGADVEVVSGTTVERSVAWPGTRITRSSRDAVLTPDFELHPRPPG